MITLFFIPLVLVGSFVAGLLGALTGLGGGVVIVPLLVVAFHVNVKYAIGASLISVIATSSGAAAAYVREGYSNIRIGMFLEIATTLGALFGAYLATRLPTATIAIVFGSVLIISSALSVSRVGGKSDRKPDRLANAAETELFLSDYSSARKSIRCSISRQALE